MNVLAVLAKRFAFSYIPATGAKRVRTVLTGTYIETVLTAGKAAAIALHPEASCWLIVDLDPHLG